jgi:3-hydroxyisobutyryl-CoA hydrolase
VNLANIIRAHFCMLTINLLRGMSRSPVVRASHRTQAIAQHMISTSSSTESLEVRSNVCLQRAYSQYFERVYHQSPVLFESNLAVRTYILNRPRKLNALNEPMLSLLRPKIEVRLPVIL